MLTLRDFKWENHSPCSKQVYKEELKKHIYFLEKNNIYWKECVPHCFPVRIELVDERNPCNLSALFCGRNTHFMKNTHFRYNVETQASFAAKQCVLESGVSSTFLPCKN
jgi:hypothetical protein